MAEIREIIYGRNMRVGPAPKIEKKGVFDVAGETTPFVWEGRLKLLESVSDYSQLDENGRIRAYCRIRDFETNELGEPFGFGNHFFSCHAENGVLYVYCTNETADGSRGGDTLLCYTSSDFVRWEEHVVIRREGWAFYNTSVCKGRDGKYILAIEAGRPAELVGKGFTNFFATSDDLVHWTMMDDSIRYSDKRYTACPVLRYVAGDDYYYMICLEALPLKRYASYIYRTKDFMTWEVGLHNPVLMVDENDRRIMEGRSFPKETEELIHTYLNINNCDIDLCEFEGRTHIIYLTGDQMTVGFACLAVYDGPLDQFFPSFFNILE